MPDTKTYTIASICEITHEAPTGFVGLALNLYPDDDSSEPERFPPDGTWPASSASVTALVNALAAAKKNQRRENMPQVEIEFVGNRGRFVRLWTGVS